MPGIQERTPFMEPLITLWHAPSAYLHIAEGVLHAQPSRPYKPHDNNGITLCVFPPDARTAQLIDPT